MPINTIKRFLQLESASGIVLFLAVVLALLISNSPFSAAYETFLAWHVGFHLGPYGLSKSIVHWVNDGLMAIFFLIVGLELKREFLEGHLSHPSAIILSGFAALGGMVVPALIYIAINYHNPSALPGWAIPAATDIAFALGVLSLLGNRVPVGLKIFLMALAIFDDFGAIIIIALFYTANLSLAALLFALLWIVVLIGMNRCGVRRISPYMLVGVLLWFSVLKSGVHSTLAGVILAFAIPLRTQEERVPSPLHRLEGGLHPWVAFLVVPLFAFANAGLSFHGMHFGALLQPLPLGIILGLFVGKQVGVMLCVWGVIKLKLARLPLGANWLDIYGLSLLCGIGFTMSLFIGTLAFKWAEQDTLMAVRLGVLCGSIISGVLGFLLLWISLRRRA